MHHRSDPRGQFQERRGILQVVCIDAVDHGSARIDRYGRAHALDEHRFEAPATLLADGYGYRQLDYLVVAR